VRYVLEGSVRKAGNRVRINGQLIDTETLTHLWADRFDGDLADVFELQDRITESVVGALQPTLRQAEIERARRKPPTNLDAYDYLLRALPMVMANASSAETTTAIELLKEAVRLYPDYAYAHAQLATCFGQMFRIATGPERDTIRTEAVAHARQAIALGPDDSSALAVAGFVLLIVGPDVSGARTALDKAVTLNPNSAMALTYRSLVLAFSGESDGAIEDAEKALRLSPLDPAGFLTKMGIVLARIGQQRYDEAAAVARSVIEANPRYPMSYVHLIVAECGRGDRAEAERLRDRLPEVFPGFQQERLPGLYQMFPEPYRSRALGLLHAAGLVAAQ
jgi:adenylate cyclase